MSGKKIISDSPPIGRVIYVSEGVKALKFRK